MGDRSQSLRSSGLRLMIRLLSVVAALLVLCLSGRASAAASAVPMCGERNESIAAPPIFRAHDPGTIVAVPCHAQQLELGTTVPVAPERIVIQERPERMLGLGALCFAQCASSRVSIVSASSPTERPGYVGSLFRPPCA